MVGGTRRYCAAGLLSLVLSCAAPALSRPPTFVREVRHRVGEKPGARSGPLLVRLDFVWADPESEPRNSNGSRSIDAVEAGAGSTVAAGAT